MVITRGLLFKGLGLCSLCAGGTVLYFKGGDLKGLVSSAPEEKKVNNPSGLVCGEADGSNCTIKEKILVKRGNDTHFELTTLVGGKIKTYKDNTYEGGSKFLIEDNDIGSDTNKLEEFETYEVKLGDEGETDVNLKGKHYLSRKTDSKTEIKKALGLPDASCDLPTSANTTQNCTISENKVGSVAISGGTVTLTISKEASKTEFPLGYKFTFKNTNDSDSTLTFGGNSITLKKNSPVDFKIKKEGSSLSLEKAWTLEELAKKVGLAKDGEDYWFVGSSGMNIKLDNSTKKTGVTKYENPTGRVKVYSDQAEYNEGLKFTIEKGDLNLKDESDGSTRHHYLGQFQSFEVVKDAGTWYLSKKEGDESKIKELLGLPSDGCDLPTEASTSKECTLTNDNIGTIKFDGAGSGDVSATGSPKLTISKESGRLDYPLGYKFTFSSTTDSSIVLPSGSTPASIPLKSNLSYEYKIKRFGDNNQTISLERAWTPKVLMEKAVGFSEGSKDKEWPVVGDEISIKQDNNKTTNAKANSSSSKIRVYEGVPDYNQGMKFVIEENDGDLTNGNSISKLSKYETYEISQDSTDNNNWYFTRKKKSEEYIKELLGLPEDCSMPTQQNAPQTCDLDVSALGDVKFDGKGDTGTTSITDSGSKVTLSISKVTGNDNGFPLGYKFTFTSDQYGFTVPLTSSSTLSIKKGTNTEFKIKESGSTLTLEKAWTAESLGRKVNLTCTSTGSESKCSFGEKINVWDANNNYVEEATVSDHNNKKLVYELDQDGYNQGIKFYVDGDSDIEINGTTGSETKPTKICKKTDGGGCTYQIMEKTEGGSAKWYLVKK